MKLSNINLTFDLFWHSIRWLWSIWSISLNFGLFGQFWSTSVHFCTFSPLWSTSGHSIKLGPFGLLQSIRSSSVRSIHFNPFCWCFGRRGLCR